MLEGVPGWAEEGEFPQGPFLTHITFILILLFSVANRVLLIHMIFLYAANERLMQNIALSVHVVCSYFCEYFSNILMDCYYFE